MQREEYIKLITDLQNTRHMLVTSGNVSKAALDKIDQIIQETQRKIDAIDASLKRPSIDIEDMN